jgi:hypothetical protein
VYGPNLTIGTGTTFGAATRIRGNATANSAAAWYVGTMTGANSALTYSTTGIGLPANAIITPGNLNYRTGAVPLVQSRIIDDGSGQRSMVRTLRVVFDGAVTFVGAPAAAFTLTRTGGGAAGFTVATATVSGVTVATLTVTGAETLNGSLVDGRYTLTVLGNQVQNATGLLDGDGNGTPGGDNVSQLHRYYGDVNGDGTVNGLDFGPFRTAFGTSVGNPAYLDYLDFNNDGAINGLDFGPFRDRFGIPLP